MTGVPVIPGLTGNLPLSHDIADYPEGIVLAVDKPYRWTSADVIRKLKFAAIKHFGKKNLKVGHAGTLDPLATGVLLVCIGNACKRAQELQDHDKEYIARIRFGATTPSYDLEKEVDRRFPFEHITEASVRNALPAFLGEQEQVAPLFSAKSVDGVRAYELARKLYRSGRLSELDETALGTLQRNKINISELELLSFGDSSSPKAPQNDNNASKRINVADTSALGLPEATVRIVCSKGTYIRAFARDLGEALGSGAHLSGLLRSRSGDYRIESALSLQDSLALFQIEQ
ncbi:MAG: tRNA pseudouridine(55) synthase TruB [Bacteroidales bacterium]|nr:tRNA pseudouridine(55) synthase TruB [Bacteroidales bacterium]